MTYSVQINVIPGYHIPIFIKILWWQILVFSVKSTLILWEKKRCMDDG